MSFSSVHVFSELSKAGCFIITLVAFKTPKLVMHDITVMMIHTGKSNNLIYTFRDLLKDYLKFFNRLYDIILFGASLCLNNYITSIFHRNVTI